MHTYRKQMILESDELYQFLIDNYNLEPYAEGTTANPIIDFVRSMSSSTYEQLNNEKLFGLQKISNLAILCQSIIFDLIDGPDQDGELKMLRRHWYRYYKVEFAQPLSLLRSEDTNDTAWESRWSGRLSQSYAEFVDHYDLTYRDLWVEDGSRMMLPVDEKLFRNCHILFCVEKDSLFGDFKTAVKAMGAACLYSGKGKSSKAAIEKMLREHFGWTEEWDPFTEDDPLYIIYISDWDYDGEAVIGPTFGEQATRYTPHIRESRIGVNPWHVDNFQDFWYLIKMSNNAYKEWAAEKALYLAECETCNQMYAVGSLSPKYCKKCGNAYRIYEGEPHGLEVESSPTRAYYRLAVQALLRLLDFDYLIERLRDECQANSYTAAWNIFNHVANNNPNYKKLLEEIQRLEKIRQEFEDRVIQDFDDKGSPHIEDWRDLEDNPTPEQFEEHLVTANYETEVWRPFSARLRTTHLLRFLREHYQDEIDDYTNEE